MKITLHMFVLYFILLSICFSVSIAIECVYGSNNSTVAYTITVSQSGDANFTTITDAINFIPPRNNQWIKISLSPGIYKEQVKIDSGKGCIFLEGRDRDTTIVTFDAHNVTSGSVTFGVYSENFVAKGVTFKNSYNRAAGDQEDPKIVPAVAFGSNGDKHAFYSCGFEGYQDTLWDNNGRHYFNSCYIEGFVDFIWGDGQSVYEHCIINVTGSGGYITAQGRQLASDPSGYVFTGCKILGNGNAYLGRAYKPFSRVIFIDSHFSNVVNRQGWFIWNQQGHEYDTTYAEVNCTGPGSKTSHRVPWEKKFTDSSEIIQYNTKAFIDQDGWIAKLPV